MNLAQHIQSHFNESIELKRRMAETLAPQVAAAGEALANALRSDCLLYTSPSPRD